VHEPQKNRALSYLHYRRLVAMKFFTNATFMVLMIAASSSDVVTGQLFWDGPRPGPNRPPEPPGPPPTECQRNCAAALYDCISSHDAPPFDETSCFNEFSDCNRGCPFLEEKVPGLRGGHFIKRVVADYSSELLGN